MRQWPICSDSADDRDLILQDLHPRHGLSLRSIVLAATGLLTAVLGLGLYLALDRAYRAEVDVIVNSTERAAQKLAFRTQEVFDRVNQSTLLVKYLRERGELPSLRALRDGGVLANAVTRGVSTIDAKGFVEDSTSAAAALNVADEDDFKALKRREDVDIIIGPPTRNPLTRGWAIPMSRRINQADGAFGGIVIAMIDPASLSEHYGLGEAPDTALGVVGLDGIYRSRLSQGKVTFGDKLDVETLETRVRNPALRGQPLRSPIDRVERFVALVRVPGYPLASVVAVDARTALAGYRRIRMAIIGWTAAAALLLAAGAGLLLGKIRELELSRRQTRRAEAVFRATLEGSLDAVSILEAKRNAEGELVDMTIIDCNSRAARLLGRDRPDVLGQPLCELSPTIRSGGFLAHFDKAIRHGRTLNAEIEATDPRLTGHWLHHQVVPIENGVALITRDVTARRNNLRMLATMAHVDPLTQLGNRRDFTRRLSEAHRRALRSGQTLAVLALDLDGFKAVNDMHGHASGDALLVGVAQRLRDCVRGTDAVCRLGGDEFAIVLEGAGHAKDVTDLCQRIVDTLSAPHDICGSRVIATPSIGVATLWPRENAESLQHRADAAMYDAKRAGKQTFRVAERDRPAVVAVVADAARSAETSSTS